MQHPKHVHCYLMTGAILVFGHSFFDDECYFCFLILILCLPALWGYLILFEIEYQFSLCFSGPCCLIGSQNLGRIRRRGGVNLASGPAERLALFLFSLLLPLALVGDVTAVPQHSQRQDHHEDDAQHGAPSENPADGFDLGLGVAVENDADFVGNLLDL